VILLKVRRPSDFPGGGVQGEDFSLTGDVVDGIAIDRRTTGGAALIVMRAERLGERMLPELFAGGGIDRVDRIGLVAMAGGVKLATCDDHSGVAEPDVGLP